MTEPEKKQKFSGNMTPDKESNPLDTEEVIKRGINGLSLHEFLKLTGMYEEGKDLPYASTN